MTHISTLKATKPQSTRILVVDDHHVNQQLAMMLIERLGHRTDVAANGQEAVDACSKIPYALIFMDCNMPVMDGYDATRAIRKAESEKLKGKRNELGVRSKGQEGEISDTSDSSLLTPSCSRVPIVAMTANTMPEDREKCLQAGMDDYLAKPIRPDSIAEIFDRWVPTDGTQCEISSEKS